MPPKLKTLNKSDSNKCVLCCSKENNEEAYGKMLRKSGITVHYFCMLFSSGLWQRGKRDCDGILGFMPSDIRREQKRGRHLLCEYCKRKGATIACTVESCHKIFHFRCGREAGGLNQFYEQFRSYCPEHRPHQTVPVCFPKARESTNSTCCICMLSVQAQVSNNMLCAPCCGGSWFHKICIQRYAMTAGAYFFKCPLCNNKELFEAEMLKFGIYIPEQDAAWEREPNAYHELLERYSNCDAINCLCPEGRDHNGDAGSQWELLLCDWCGSSGTHVQCCGFVDTGKESLCRDCAEISNIIQKDKTKQTLKTGPVNKTSYPRVAGSVEEIRQQLEEQRTCLLRARRSARRRKTVASTGKDSASTSEQQEQRPVTVESSESEDEEVTSLASPRLLEDCRLINSTPVVRIERATCETEVNILDSEEEGGEILEEDAGESSQPGCARLLTLPQVSPTRQPDQQSAPKGSWDVTGVIERGEKKVVLLSMFNKQDSSKDSSVQSATLAMQQQLMIQASSTTEHSKETGNLPEENIDKESATFQTVKHVSHSRCASSIPRHRLRKKLSASGHDREEGSSEEEDTSVRKNRFLIPNAGKAILRKTIPALLHSQATEPPQVFQISDSSSDQEDTDNIFLPQNDSQQSGKGQAARESVSRQKNQAKVQPLTESVIREKDQPKPVSQSHPAVTESVSRENVQTRMEPVSYPGPSNSNLFVDIISVPEQQSTSVAFQSSMKNISHPKNNTNDAHVTSFSRGVISESEFSSSIHGHPPTLGGKKCSYRPGSLERDEPARVTNTRLCAENEISNPPTQISEKIFHLLKLAVRSQQAQETENMNSQVSETVLSSGQSGSKVNPVTDSAIQQIYNERDGGKVSKNAVNQNADRVTVPDDVLAMHRSIPPAFTQFQVPKPKSSGQEFHASLSATASIGSTVPPVAVPATAAQFFSSPSVQSPQMSAVSTCYPDRLSNSHPQIRGAVTSDSSPGTASSVQGYPNSDTSASQYNPRSSALLHSNTPSTSQTYPAVTVTTNLNVSAPPVDQHYYITIPTTQAFQLGVLTVQSPQGAVSMPQAAAAASIPVSEPYNVTMMAGQPQPGSLGNSPSHFIPAVPQTSLPVMQWIPVSRCFPNPPQQAAGSQCYPDQSKQMVHVLQPDPSARQPQQQLVSTLPPYPVTVPSDQPSRPGSHQMSALQRVPITNTQPSQAHNSNQSYHDGQPSRHCHSVVQPSSNSPPKSTVPPSPDVHDQQLHVRTAVSKPQPVARDGIPDPQSSAQSSCYTSIVQPSLSGTRPQLSSHISRLSGSAVHVSHPSASLVDGMSDTVRESSKGSGVMTMPVTLYARPAVPFPAATVTSPSQLSTRITQPGTTMLNSSYHSSQGTQSISHKTPTLSSILHAPSLNCQTLQNQADGRASGIPQVTTVRPVAPAVQPTRQVVTPTTNPQHVQPALATRNPQSSEIRKKASVSHQTGPSANSAVVPRSTQAAGQTTAMPGTIQPVRPVAQGQPGRVPMVNQQTRAGIQAEVPPVVIPSSDGDNSLTISRGKIWLASEDMQSQLMKNDVVTLSDSDGSDDLEITGTSLGQTVPGGPGHRLLEHCSHSAPDTALKGTTPNVSKPHTPRITGLLVPAPDKPPCPVHGHFRLVHHPRPSVPAKRNPDGSISIDLTEDEPAGATKRARTEEINVVDDNDSDLEIIG